MNVPPKPTASFLPVVGNPKYIVTLNGFVYDTNFRGKGFTRSVCHVVNNIGYVKVSLSYPPIRKIVSVHRLVAQAFIPNPLNLPDVDHIDLNKENNHFSNLRWVTHGQNLAYAREKLGNWNVPAHQPYLAYQFIDNVPTRGNFLQFPSLIKAAEHFGRNYHTFASVVAKAVRRQGYAYGYLWEPIQKF